MTPFPPASEHGSEDGLFTLTQIQHLMRVEFNRAERYDYPVVCLVIAVDQLGHLRDLYGYDCKEEVMRNVTELLVEKTRRCDYLGRMPDDRLLAVVPHTDEEGIQVMLGRIMASAREIEIVREGRRLELTLSVGTSHNRSGKTLFFDALLFAAEGALIEATEKGGNCIVTRAPGESGEPGEPGGPGAPGVAGV